MSFGSLLLFSARISYHSPFVRVCGKTAGRRHINLLPCMAVDNDDGVSRDDALLYVCNLQSPALPARIRYPAKVEITRVLSTSGLLSCYHYEPRKSES